MFNKTILAACIVALTMGLSACVVPTTTVQQNETQGQQLIDLKAAYDQGLITEKEFNATRKKILKGK